MKIILQTDVDKLGMEGDVLEVADGYARNYLFPRQLAVQATPSNLKQLEKKITLREEQKKQEIEIANDLAAKIQDVTVVLRVKAGEKGKLYGSVTNSIIAAKLEEEEGISIDRRKIDLREPIKEVGFYTINIRLHQEVIVELNVQVEAEVDEKEEEKKSEGEGEAAEA
ncbi:MAG: 50S ribosomal protein L9 [Clostridia bacterium]|nr:50S ribosomal protein L9 [Clostridia bacterium]